MTAYPLFELVKSLPAPMPPLAAYLRDSGKRYEEIEARRKDELRRHLNAYDNGVHPAHILISLQQTLFDNYLPWRDLYELADADAEKLEREFKSMSTGRGNITKVRKNSSSNRSWRGTDYVSRAKDSLWVRKDLPAALARFLTDDTRPDMHKAMLSITSERGLNI